MTDTLTPEKREEIRKRAEAATPGPWWTGAKYSEEEAGVSVIAARTDCGALPGNPTRGQVAWATQLLPEYAQQCEADAVFIAHAREDIPALLSALDAAIERAENAEESIAKNGGAGILLSRLAEAQAQRDALKARVAELEGALAVARPYVSDAEAFNEGEATRDMEIIHAALKENSHDKG